MRESRILSSCVALAALAGAASQLASAQSPGSVKVKVQLLANLEGQDAVRVLAFSPDGKILAASGHDVTVWLWDVSKQKRRAILNVPGGFQSIAALTFSPDGKRLAVTAGAELLRIWDVSNGTKVLDLEDRSGGLSCIAFSADGKLMATAGMRIGFQAKSATGVLKWREAKDGAAERTLAVQDGPINSIDFSPDGKTLALVTSDRWGGLKMLASDTTEVVATLATRGRSSGLNIKLRSVLKLVDLGTGKVVRSVTTQHDSADVVKFSPDGRTLATGGADSVVKLWDVATCKERCQLKGHREDSLGITSLAFSPDGKLLASADRCSVKLWDVASGQELREASKQLKGGTAVAFAPQGCILATGRQDEIDWYMAPRRAEGENRIIRLWELQTSEPAKLRK